MPRKATKKVGAGPAKTDDLKVAQSYNPNISDYDSDKEGDVNKTKLKRQYRKRTSKQHTDIKPLPKQTRMPRGYNPSDDSEEEYNPPAKRYGKRNSGSGSEPASKKAKTNVPEKLPNNNKDKEIKIKKEQDILRCQCVKCPELEKIIKIKRLLVSSTDQNSNLIIRLKEIVITEHNDNREYVECEDYSVYDSIKTEPITFKTEPKVEPEDNEDPDDPEEPVKQSPVKTSAKVVIKPKVERMMSCILCTAKDGKNLSGYNEVKYHMSVCLFSIGAYTKFLPPKQGDDVKIEEYGKQFRYRCQVENCEKSAAKSKSMGYREFVMHTGSSHGILERWAKETNRDGAQELYQALKTWREEAGRALPEIPSYEVEEVHTCLLCHGEGEGGKETRSLSFAPDKIRSTRYHYSSCLFDFGDGVYLEKYKPDPRNLNEDGSLNDLLGKVYKYTCEVCPKSKKPRQRGYKEYTTHQANNHGGLEEILMEHKDEKLRQLVSKLRKRC